MMNLEGTVARIRSGHLLISENLFLRLVKGPVVLLVVCIIAVYWRQPNFFTAANLESVVYHTCLLVPALLGMHLLVVLGLFDLSIGSVAAFCGVVLASSFRSGFPTALCVSLGLCGGLLLGTINWLLVSRFRIPALVGTLITMGIARAAAMGITEGRVLGGVPDGFGWFVLAKWRGLSFAILSGFVVVAVFELLSRRHVLVRHMYHAGSNREAVSNAGVSVAALEAVAFITAGIGASVTGILQCSRTLSASPTVFPDLALDCLAACVIGGARISGGSGSPIGSLLGMVIVVLSRNLAILADISLYWRDLGVALVLLAAALLNRTSKTD
jgi:ribose transport system permease protein